MRTITFADFTKLYDVKFKSQKGDSDFIGAGGYGSVYKGYSHQMHIEVAIKKSDTDKELLVEVEKASKMPIHKNIARYLDGFRVDSDSGDFDVAILQYYKKGNLTQLLENEVLTERQLDGILVGILEGLQFLHDGFKDSDGSHICLIHRDLKPQNILIAEYNGMYTPLITDFGISKEIHKEDFFSSGKFENSTVAGTLVYKAPEQIMNTTSKKNLDLWAFGVMLFRILKGALPFYSYSSPNTDSFALEVMKQITSADLNEIFAQIADQPQKYQKVIKRCLVRDINERVQTERELIDIISEVFQKENIVVEDTDYRAPVSLPISPKIIETPVSKLDHSSQKKLGLASKIFLGTALVLIVVFSLLSINRSGTNYVSENTTVIDAKTSKIQEADSLFVVGKAQLDTLDKNVAYKTFKKAVELNPALKPSIYTLFKEKIFKLRTVPDVAHKYEVLAKDFK